MPYDTVRPSDLFECEKCGECCKGYGGTYVSEADVEAISKFVGEDPAVFVEKYCRMSGGKPVLAQGPDGYCVFRKNKICSIHPVKPRMCRAWPFIEAVLTDVGNWRAMASACPGIRADFPDEVVLKCVEEVVSKRNSES